MICKEEIFENYYILLRYNISYIDNYFIEYL